MPTANPHTIKVAVDISKGILVHAKGNPAKVVALGAAAGVAFIATTVGYGGYQLGKKLFGKKKGRKALKKRY